MKFFYLFIYGKISQQKLFDDVLETKKAFWDYKKQKVKKVDKNRDFSKGFSPWIWWKIWNNFSIFLFWQSQPAKCVWRYSRNKKSVFRLWKVVTSLDSINGWLIQTLLRGENDSKQSDEIQANGLTSLEKSRFFNLFNTVFYSLKTLFYFIEQSNTFCWLILPKIKTWKNVKFFTKTMDYNYNSFGKIAILRLF